jgi:hypothetical protein
MVQESEENVEIHGAEPALLAEAAANVHPGRPHAPDLASKR